MSIDEMETVWREQKVDDTRSERFQYWTRKARTSSRALVAALWIAFVVTILGAGLKVHRLLTDAEITLSNSGVDLLISFVTIGFAGVGLRQYFRHRRALASLTHDPAACIKQLMQGTRQEIQDIRWRLPLAFSGILSLAALAKWQSVSTGYETMNNAAGGLVLIFVLVLIAGAAMFHRLKAFLEPRLRELGAALSEFQE